MSKEKIDFPRPKDNTSLRTLLGVANYFRGFVPNHPTIVAPLHRMIDHSAAKRSSIVWTTESITAFRDIRIAISRCPVMHFLDDVSPIRLYTDASAYGIGGVLSQIVDDVWKPIAFVSKSLWRHPA
jgi:RNase H-like domain found in reverse transcriptase